MTDNESPKLEAVANLSPVSPRPLHNTYTLPQVLPELQDQAEDPDVVPLEPDTFRTAAAAMAPNPDPPVNALDNNVAEGSSSDSTGNDAQSQDVSIADDDSFEYDEDGNGQEQENPQQEGTAVGPEPEIDDYARTFDSPKEQADVADEEGEAQQPQHEDVTKTPESMNISEQLAGVPEQSAAQIVSADATALGAPAQGSQPTHTAYPAQDALVPPESDQQPTPAFQDALPHASASASPSLPQQSVSSPDPDKVDPDKLDTAVPSNEQPDVQPEDVDMNMGGDSDATAIDIQKLVDEITAKAEAEAEAEASSEQPPAKPSASLQTPSSSSMDVDLPSLPPKPALTQEQSQQTYSPATYHHASVPNAPPYSSAPTGLPSQPAFSAANGTPGAHMSQPPTYNPTPSFASYPNAYPPGTAPPSQAPANNGAGLQQTYDEFLADERKHMSEAKWERFPDGSRIFIGNLSQERVSKRDVFELFHHYGRLAQISLKSAYGFVQYHTNTDAQAAMSALQGAEVKGRKINLEVSKTQKSKKDRDHSPERKNRDRGGKGADRYDGRDSRRSRGGDDYRPGRSPSPPRRGDHRGRQDSYNRERGGGHHDSFNRKRSRSPEAFGRHGHESYRRRSPSPYGRSRQGSDNLDIPRRYGNDVPDVQILLMQDVHKDFVEWVQRAFMDARLRVTAMFLNPRFPRDAVIQRQVLEGVHAVVELDMRAQTTAKIPLQVFDRSAGNNVRFDQYQELDPPIAAQLVLRTKGSVASQPTYPPQASYPPQPYATPAPYGAYQQPAAPAQQYPAAAPDLTSIMSQLSQMGNVDSATLQTILASLQQPPQPHTPSPAMHPAHSMGAQAAPNAGVDLNALINNLAAASANNAPSAGAASGMPGYPAPAYQQAPRGPAMPPAAGSSDPARDVQNIMDTLARIRQ
ncbi:RNA recognition domain-containing protein [Diaporthe amygdali]|uniref:RNA recognition domain-containing protein n=1 Tax=Phomopsis amygdali TaxID=1214568 RepID=UPI0022FE6873|nr:RNA recognition domain-containing protein [Diaporthe amygdali]KAJ0117276.1 RNA recognition domain-containing protein [Diaporthe amygdali]